MKKVVIFDFNRTLYNPEKRRLMSGARMVLAGLNRRGYYLYLISSANPSRKELVRSLDVAKYFKLVFIVRSKNTAFQKIAKRRILNKKDSFVVGDRARREVRHGNECGFQTIWLRAGKFASELPRIKLEKPKYTVLALDKILRIIK